MREIKFRAWDGRKMQHRVLPVLADAFVEYGGIGKHLITSDLTKGVLMQFTGLTDKNGIEIYEGDILRAKQNQWGYIEHLMKCEWLDEHACFTFTILDKNAKMMSNSRDGTPSVGDSYAPKVIENWAEIIGNIMEDPELLK